MIRRSLQTQIEHSLKKKSVLLLGPRQTGKSTLMGQIEPDLSFNLAREDTFLSFIRDPGYLENILADQPKGKLLILIDEVQRVPRLLNSIQVLIDDHRDRFRFALTGSSARKLRRGRANLLPGRLHTYELGPLVAKELGYEMDLNKALGLGTLPEIYLDEDAKSSKKLLKSYAITYLNEEIKAEGLTKNLESFTRFLFQIAADSARFLDLSKISKACRVPRQTTQRYFEILEDTLIIKRCDSFAKSDKRRLVQHPRFFFFDPGVVNALLNNFTPSADRQGFLFETLLFNQLHLSLSYADEDFRISSYRTEAGAEVDFIIEVGQRLLAIEAKAGNESRNALRGFASFSDFAGGKKVEKFVLTAEKIRSYREGDVRFMNWQEFLKENKW